jgi:2-hydroxychromene-2-carboxylate isomerase
MLSVRDAEPKKCAIADATFLPGIRLPQIECEEVMKTVDFYFDYSSTNSYFAAFLLPAICRKHGALVNWLPVHSAALFRGTGFDVMAMTPRKARYLWRDHQRYAEFTGLPFRKPSRFPIKTSAGLRATLMIPGLIGNNPDDYTAAKMGDFAQAVMRVYWERDADISDPVVLAELAAEVGISSDGLIAAADSPDARARLAAVTEAAIARGVFGVPMFCVAGEMFWGKDRLDFVERLLRSS